MVSPAVCASISNADPMIAASRVKSITAACLPAESTFPSLSLTSLPIPDWPAAYSILARSTAVIPEEAINRSLASLRLAEAIFSLSPSSKLITLPTSAMAVSSSMAWLIGRLAMYAIAAVSTICPRRSARLLRLSSMRPCAPLTASSLARCDDNAALADVVAAWRRFCSLASLPVSTPAAVKSACNLVSSLRWLRWAASSVRTLAVALSCVVLSLATFDSADFSSAASLASSPRALRTWPAVASVDDASARWADAAF